MGETGTVTNGEIDFEADDGSGPTYSVGELIAGINDALRDTFGDGVWVRGEIRGFKEGANGHAYFDLVGSEGGKTATINVSFFSFARQRLRPLLTKNGLRLADGLKVRIRGNLDVYAVSGRLGLKMQDIDPRFTLGELALERDAVLKRLRDSGLFDANRSLEMPAVPLGVGVVTSITSAAWQDFSNELSSSGIGFELFVVDSRVQGDEAIDMVSRAIRLLEHHPKVDVIVVIRGGGSKTDLAAFDAEKIAMSILRCSKPVLTGLGHEIDRSIADEVANQAHKTPTACARALVDRVHEFSARAEQAWGGVVDEVVQRLERATEDLDRAAERIPKRATRVLDAAVMALDRSGGRLTSSARRHATVSLARLDGVEGRVRALDPARTLARGWSITRTTDGRVVRSVADAAPGSELVTTVADGTIRSTVEG